MAAISEKELIRIIKSGEASGFYYIFGTDHYSVMQYKKALVSSVVKKGDETYNLHEFEGKGIDVEAVSDACDALPMFAEKVCVTVRDLDLDSERLSEGRMKLLTETINNLPDTTVLIIYAPNAEISDGKKGVPYKSKNKKLSDLAEKKGTLCHLTLKTRAEAIKLLCGMVSKKGGSLEDKAAGRLWEKCCGDMNLCVSELGKLTAYANGAVITTETVELLTSDTGDAKAYNLADAIAVRNVSLAMELFNELTDARAEPVYLLYTIAGSINDLYRARLALDYNHSVSDVVNDFGYNKAIEFRVRNAFSAVRNTPLEYLKRCNEILADADNEMKTGAGIPSVIIETAIAKMLAG